MLYVWAKLGCCGAVGANTGADAEKDAGGPGGILAWVGGPPRDMSAVIPFNLFVKSDWICWRLLVRLPLASWRTSRISASILLTAELTLSSSMPVTMDVTAAGSGARRTSADPVADDLALS